MKRIFLKALVCLVMTAMVATGLPLTGILKASAATTGSISQITVSGAKVYVYTPSNPRGDGLETPLVSVYTNSAVADTNAALQTITDNGIKDIAEKEGCFVFVFNPANGSTWDATADTQVFLTLQGSLTNNTGYVPGGIVKGKNGAPDSYVGDPELCYVYAEGAGADFVNANLLKENMATTMYGKSLTKPSAAALFNMSNSATATAAMPAFLVNGTKACVGSFKELNSTDTTKTVDGFTTYVNSKLPAQQVITATSSTTSGFDAALVKKAWSDLLIKTRADTTGSLGKDFYVRPDYTAEGINVQMHDQELVTSGTSSRKHTWISYIPKNIDLTSGKKYPLVLGLHGGMNNATFFAEQSEWPEVAAENGFIFISIQHEDGDVDAESPQTIVDLLQYFEKTLPVDTTKVYASGFSMGSSMSLKLGTLFPQYFAGIAPMEGSAAFAGTTYSNLIIPTFYVAGTEDPLPVLPHQSTGTGNGSANDLDSIFAAIYSQNNVTYTGFDRNANQYFGIKFDSTYTTTLNSGHVMTTGLLKSSKDGVAYTALTMTGYKTHDYIPGEANAAWNFLKKFSRSADGSIIVANDTPAAPAATAQPKNPPTGNGNTTNEGLNTVITLSLALFFVAAILTLAKKLRKRVFSH